MERGPTAVDNEMRQVMPEGDPSDASVVLHVLEDQEVGPVVEPQLEPDQAAQRGLAADLGEPGGPAVAREPVQQGPLERAEPRAVPGPRLLD